MKLAFVNFGSDICGGNRVLFQVVNGLIGKGHEVNYLALQPQNWFPLKTQITVCKEPNALAEAIPESDIVVATWCMTAYVVDSVKGRKGIPAYYCQHYESIFFFSQEEKEAVAKTYDLPLNLIANSPWLQQQLQEKHKHESKLIVPGVDLNIFKPAEREPPGKGEPFKVLAFASNTLFKGFYDTVLPAFHYVSKRKPNVQFHVYGKDLPIPYDFKVEKHQCLKDSELAELYNSCDLFVSGSWAESSPLPHLEAMACGCPVLSTAIGTEHYGEAIVRARPRSPRAFAQAILAMTEAPKLFRELSKLGCKTAKQFPWQKTVDVAEAFFKELIGE